ncbi:MAG: DUF4197 domain-containing protein [Saprospiraceae bacterium]|nr:DUF4197 domain-containing protein [Saprospiraceae bacterium]MBK8372033.1 DUF4197 domain-containing protein [Saprospiraceae bacterium]MBK8818515.1 DUF4197 domain-containing protein [Saprospiraceae bacterium]MBK8852643.1 DUF4197 domain-containing protein [Saprospiraceae bacterium]MBK9042291.1 DUF4197 domain-containing protein [Saprospiraceae bacterium]
MKYISYILIPLFIMSCDPKDFQRILDTANQNVLTNADISSGLKEALNIGVQKGVTTLSAQNGYYESIYKILLPLEAKKVVDKLKFIPGFADLEKEAVKKINLAAEDAAKSASPIFVKAIREMTISDVTNILMGDKNAATLYLHNKTYQNLYSEFNPVIITSLNKFGALNLWKDAITKYNSLPFVEKINPDLGDHVTRKALDGLFALIEQKELGIRTDISQRTSDLLKKVFAKQDKP